MPATFDPLDQAQVNQPYRFQSHYYDETSGLTDFGFRFYSAGMGRFINQDPIEEEGGINLYGFVGGNPTNDFDEDGLAPAKKRYVLYAKVNHVTGKVYSGISSGPLSMTAEQIVAARDVGHKATLRGFGKAILVKESYSYEAIRGAEDRAIKRHGGGTRTGGTSGNPNRGINPKRTKAYANYRSASEKEFGKIATKGSSRKFNGLFKVIDKLSGNKIAGPYGFLFELIDPDALLKRALYGDKEPIPACYGP